ncbi:hypothetical protein I3843_01G080000 [Carya illinoinensis]|nr:hypothetical protein I3843_01G080000 [Carya illinoinensis]
MSTVSSLPTHARSKSPSLPREFTSTMAFSEVALAYQLSSLTTVALIFVAFDVVGNEWTFSLYPLLTIEDLKQPLVARVRQWTHTPLVKNLLLSHMLEDK